MSASGAVKETMFTAHFPLIRKAICALEKCRGVHWSKKLTGSKLLEI
jgi:hypothetical protein